MGCGKRSGSGDRAGRRRRNRVLKGGGGRLIACFWGLLLAGVPVTAEVMAAEVSLEGAVTAEGAARPDAAGGNGAELTAGVDTETELIGRWRGELGLHRLLLRRGGDRMVLRGEVEEGAAGRISGAGEGRWYRWGTLQLLGLPALMSAPLDSSFTSRRRAAPSGLEIDIAVRPIRRSGAALLLPERGGLYVLDDRDGLSWGGWGVFSLGEEGRGEAAWQIERPRAGEDPEVWGDAAVQAAGELPLRLALRLALGEPERGRLQGTGFLSLSSVLPAGWAFTAVYTLRRARWQCRGGGGVQGGVYPDPRGHLQARRARGGLRITADPLPWLEMRLRGACKLRVPGRIRPAPSRLESEAACRLRIGGAPFHCTLRAEGKRRVESEALPSRQRAAGLGFGGRDGWAAWSCSWLRKEKPGEAEDSCRLELRGGPEPFGWQIAYSAESGAGGATRGSAELELELEYEHPQDGYLVWAELAWQGEWGGRAERGAAPEAEGGSWCFTLGYTVRGVLPGERPGPGDLTGAPEDTWRSRSRSSDRRRR